MDDWVAAARLGTPGVERVAHLNNAGAALMPAVVVDTVVDHLRREAEIGGYEAAAEAAGRLDGVRSSIAALVNAEAAQIALVENATRAWDMAVYGYPFEHGDRVLTGRAEYASNAIGLLQLQRRFGLDIVLIDDDEHGQISLDHLDEELSAGAALVSLTHAPTGGGLVNPAVEVGERCREHGAFYVLDACQSVGQVPVDVEAIGCDVASTTSRKYLRGPRGVGFLYAGPRALEVLEPPFLDLHAAEWVADDRYEIRPDARRFETWEASCAAQLGLGAAVELALDLGIDRTWSRVRDLGAVLRRELEVLDGVTVRDKGLVRGGIVTFTVDGRSAAEVRAEVGGRGVNVHVTPPEHSRFDLPHRGLPTLVRASVHYYNTEDEIGRLVDALQPMLPRP